MNTTLEIIQFELPGKLACARPTEARSMDRDDVRLMVTTGSGQMHHTFFKHLDRFLHKGDLLVVNTSAMRPSAIPVMLPDGQKGVIHLSTHVENRRWLVEIRVIKKNETKRWKDGEEGMTFILPDGAGIKLQSRYYQDLHVLDLWLADFNIPGPVETYLSRHARPIQYSKLEERWPLEYYQTYFSFHPGSAEMPSAARGFTPGLVERLLASGVLFAPVLLHTGVSSLEDNETPYPEYMEVQPLTASLINTAREQGGQIIAVGTTAIRAIESAVNEGGRVIPYKGNTELFIESDYKMRVVDGLITGFHEPRASHLHMLQSLAGFDHIEDAYREAIEEEYFWHQFGDLHLILSEQ